MSKDQPTPDSSVIPSFEDVRKEVNTSEYDDEHDIIQATYEAMSEMVDRAIHPDIKEIELSDIPKMEWHDFKFKSPNVRKYLNQQAEHLISLQEKYDGLIEELKGLPSIDIDKYGGCDSYDIVINDLYGDYVETEKLEEILQKHSSKETT